MEFTFVNLVSYGHILSEIFNYFESICEVACLRRTCKNIKKIVDEKNEHITDSITYALTIQESILPKPELFKRIFKD